jgi:transposase-like protein
LTARNQALYYNFMDGVFPFVDFRTRFPDDTACLEEIKKIKYQNGIYCRSCNKITKHYKLKRGSVYSCKFCRSQTRPLAGTLFEKSSTPLRVWFFAFFLMTHSRAKISCKQLQRELGVTYKTAWRLHKNIKMLMEQNNGDLLKEAQEKYKEHRWVFFNKLEISWVEKHESKS